MVVARTRSRSGAAVVVAQPVAVINAPAEDGAHRAYDTFEDGKAKESGVDFTCVLSLVFTGFYFWRRAAKMFF